MCMWNIHEYCQTKYMVAGCCDGRACPGQNGATPLYVAAQNGHVEAVRELVKAGAKIEAAMTVGGGGEGEIDCFIQIDMYILSEVKGMLHMGIRIQQQTVSYMEREREAISIYIYIYIYPLTIFIQI